MQKSKAAAPVYCDELCTAVGAELVLLAVVDEAVQQGKELGGRTPAGGSVQGLQCIPHAVLFECRQDW